MDDLAPRIVHWFVAWLYKVYIHEAVSWPEDTRPNFDDTVESYWIADRSDNLRAEPKIHTKAFSATERVR